MNTKTILGILVAVLIFGGGAFFYSKNAITSIVGAQFVCTLESHYLRVSDNGIAYVIDFGKQESETSSKIYVDKGVDVEGHKSKGYGVFTIYHDDQYDPAEQKGNIPALTNCKHNGKTVFEIYGRSIEKFQEVITSSRRNDAPSDI